eukprot:XP_011672214.1 PREDICTED: cell wall protein RBR3-like [Strongylocentrotus purpuratus]
MELRQVPHIMISFKTAFILNICIFSSAPTTVSMTPPTTSRPTHFASTEATTNSIMDSTTSNPTTTTKSTTMQDTTTMPTTEATTSHSMTTTPSTTSLEATTNSITDSTTSNPTTTTKSTTTQVTTIMSTKGSSTSRTTTATPSTAKIFVTDEDVIFVADLQGDLDFTSIPSTNKPRYITYDSVEKKIYWTDEDTKRVYRADVDGANREEVTSGSSIELRGIAIAETSRTLYIANKGTKKITSVSIAQGDSFPRAEMDFTSELSEELYSLEVDEEKGFLYWTMKYGILRKPLNGSGSTETVYSNSDLSEITGLSIDLSRNPRRIFFCDFDKERSFYMDVNQPHTTAEELTSYMNDADISGSEEREKLQYISYFNGTLYWTKGGIHKGIAVMTNYDQSSPSFDIKETSVLLTMTKI